jgi:ribosome-binding ATPase YchF (GTP1/OBG family)
VELEAGRGARSASLTEDEAVLVKGLGLLTLKPLIYAANVGEDDLGNHGANNVHVQVGRLLQCMAVVALVQGSKYWRGRPRQPRRKQRARAGEY